MPCESCAVQFSVFRRKRACAECERYYCGGCLRRGGGTMCAACRILSTRPLARHSLVHLKVRDLQYFLHRQNVSTRGCVEKEDLVNLVVSHVNSGGARRRPPPPPPPRPPAPDFTHTFSTSIKGFTTNLNTFINSAFDIRPPATPAPAPAPHPPRQPPPHSTTVHGRCYNSSYSHTPQETRSAESVPSSSGHTARTTTRPAPPQALPPDAAAPAPASPDEPSLHHDTADCLEIEDLDDTAEWEFVNRPAEPLPNDSNVLLAESGLERGESALERGESGLERGELGARATSELDLRRSGSPDTPTDTSSLKDEPLAPAPEAAVARRVRLEDVRSLVDLQGLSAKQLKELLALNRVDFKGCVERDELLERAKRLWRETTKSREEINSLSMEESCKICMDAPMECVLLECGHIAACTACSKRLSECPICRQYVVRVVRFFRS